MLTQRRATSASQSASEVDSWASLLKWLGLASLLNGWGSGARISVLLSRKVGRLTEQGHCYLTSRLLFVVGTLGGFLN